MRMRIGFLGLGTMGAPMAKNLLLAGHALTIYNRSDLPKAALVEQGARVARTPADAARGQEIVITMLSDENALLGVLDGPDGLIAGLSAGTILVDMSTIGRAAALTVAAK